MAQQVEEKTNIPARMQALQLMQFGQDMSKALQLNEIDVPNCGDGDIMIKVHSVSLNPVDWKIAKGYLGNMMLGKKEWGMPQLATEIKKDEEYELIKPRTIGRDYSGVIVQMGVNANKDNKFRVGMRVAGMVDIFGYHGSFSEYIVTNPQNVAKIDDKLDFDTAAAIPLVTITSYQALMERTPLKDTKDAKILILGGSSSCGLVAIQTAKLQGASEIAVTSSQEELCKKYGATKVYNYKIDGATEWYEDLKGNSYDIVYDCIGELKSLERAQEHVLKKNGSKYVTIAGPPGRDDTDVLFNFMHGTTKGMQELYDLVDAGNFAPVFDKESPFTLDKWLDMVNKSANHKARGKLIMRFVNKQ